jgi:serine/threonine protein kinase
MAVQLDEDLTLKQVLKMACKKFSSKEDYKRAKLYNKDGVHIMENDFSLIAAGDILYLALKGENFSYYAILDDYEMGRTLGVGGFGKVVLGRHREKGTEVAIKFTDCGE